MAHAFEAADIELPITYELNALPAMKDLVMEGAGSAIVNRSSIATEVKQGKIEARKIDADNMNFDVFLTLSRAAQHSRAAIATAELIQEIASAHFKP